jgi:hypothetical protein
VIKKAGIFVLVVALFLVSLGPTLVQAQGGLTILASSAETDFPSKLSFNLSAESDVDITDIRLHYTVDYESFAQVTSEAYIEFAPATNVDVGWDLDMVKVGGLPPGTGLEYWWTVKDAKGDKTATVPAKVRFDDNRYSWRSLTKEKVTIYWYEGEQSFADELMSATQQALARLAEETGAYLKRSVKMYIYANSQDLQGAMIYPQEWTGGVAFTRYGIIAIGIGQSNLSWGKGSIAHELTHLVVHQMTFNPYISLPTWLEEGLAMYTEGTLGAGFVDYLNNATEGNSLISVRSLSSPFSAYSNQATLSYAESYSLVDFLITSYGQGKMLELLTTFSEGSSYDGALERVYGFDMDGLDTLWRDYVGKHYQNAGLTTEATSPALIGTLTKLATQSCTREWNW